MGFLNSFIYEEAKPMFDCAEGENDMCIKRCEIVTTKNGAQAIVVYCNVRNSNGEQYRHYIVEGQYFDKSLSQFMDCFGIVANDLVIDHWVNHVGRARFDHYKYNSQTKKTETVAELQCHLLRKEGFKQPENVNSMPMQNNAANQNGSGPKATIEDDFPF